MDKERVASTRIQYRWIKGLFYSTLLTSLFWGGIAQFDPFGIKAAASIQSGSLFMRMIGGPWYDSTAQDKITVVLIDDSYIREIGESWPMSYIAQDMLLTDILAFKPKAVFIDLLYSHNHETPNDSLHQLVDTISQNEINADSAIPIFIPLVVQDVQGVDTCSSSRDFPPDSKEANAKKDIESNIPVIIEIEQSNAHKTYTGWAGCGDGYPSFIFQDKQYMTPAFALYEEVCRADDKTFKADCSALQAGDYSAFKKPMMVRWGTIVSKEHKAALKAGGILCADIDKDSFSSKIGYLGSQLWSAVGQSFSSTANRGKSESCTYTDTVHATWFLGGGSQKTHEDLKGLIGGRIVLLGTQITGVHDTTISPINGQVPGVYLFAMALDNYLTYGSDYFKLLSDVPAAVIEILALLAITFSMGILGHIAFVHFSKIDQSINFLSRLGLSILFFLFLKIIIPVCMSLLLALIMWQCRIAPMDWIGISLLSFIANPIKLRDCFINCKELTRPFAFS